MAVERLTEIPSEIFAGATIRWTLTFNTFLASEGGTVSFYLNSTDRKINSTDLTVTASGDDYLVDAASTVTALWPAGTYYYQIEHVLSGETDIIETGQIIVKARQATDTGFDGRTHNKKRLDAIRSEIDKLIADPAQSVFVGGVQYNFIDINKLYKMEGDYEVAVNLENGIENKTVAEFPETY
jgi:hypothetical protein